MAQPGFCPNFVRLTTEGHQFETTNPELTEATNSMNSFDSTSKDKFQCTYFRSRFSKTAEKKNSISWLDNTATSDISDPYSDSDSEADNRKNVARWLKSLPTNQDWYDIEDDLPNRQGDFEKGTTSNVETLSKNSNKEEFYASQPSTSFKNDTPTTSSDQKSSKNKFSKANGPKHKSSAGKIKSGKLKVYFKETPTEIRSENSKYSKLSVSRDSQLQNSFESFKESKNTDNEDKVKRRKFPYNLRSLDFRKVERKIEARISDSKEKMSRCRRSCSIRNQEYKKKSRGIPSANDEARRHQVFCQVEDLKPARKLKSPFTKQASSSKTPALFTGIPCMSSYKLKELKEAKQNVQKLDRGTGKQKYVDRKGIVKFKLAKNKKLLKTVKDLVNVIDSNTGPDYKSHLRKHNFTQNEGIENSELMSPRRSNKVLKTERKTLKDLSKNRPPIINSKTQKKLDLSMEVALKRYKQTHETWEVIANKQSFDQLEEPPRKKKKIPVF